MTSPDCSERRPLARELGVANARRLEPRAAALRGARRALLGARRSAFARLFARAALGVRSVRRSRTSASRACSAPRPARCSPTCRSRSATRSTTRRRRLAVKALFATGFFRDVRLEVEDDVLVVIVQERPTISKVDIRGNKEFDTDTLKKALKEIGVADARIFDRSALDRAEQEIKRQYLSRGRYAAKVHDDGHAAGAQSRRDQHRDRGRRRRRRSRGSTSSARARSARSELLAR